MKVEINHSTDTFRFHSSYLMMYFGMNIVDKLFEEDLMVYCMFGTHVSDVRNVRIVQYYNKQYGEDLNIHYDIINQYIDIIYKQWHEYFD